MARPRRAVRPARRDLRRPGARHPDAGGVSSYARLAFGAGPAALVGWCFFFAIPVGAPAAALFAGDYVGDAFGGGRVTVIVTAVALLAGVAAANAVGMHASARLQFILAGVLLVLMLAAVAVSLPHASWAHLHPFAAHGWTSVVHAGALLVWSFAGWEAITHLAAEFRNPDRDLPRATAIALGVVGVLYLAVAVATVAVLGASAGSSRAPLADLLAYGPGGARRIAAVMAVLLTAGVLNAYFAGAAKLGAALARDGALPDWLAGGSAVGEVPRRSLAALAAMALTSFAVVEWTAIDVRPLVLLTSAQLATVYAVGIAAALRLLPRRGAAHRGALLGTVAIAALLAAVGPYLVWPLVLAVGAVVFVRRKGLRRPGVARVEPPIVPS